MKYSWNPIAKGFLPIFVWLEYIKMWQLSFRICHISLIESVAINKIANYYRFILSIGIFLQVFTYNFIAVFNDIILFVLSILLILYNLYSSTFYHLFNCIVLFFRNPLSLCILLNHLLSSRILVVFFF